MGSSWWYSFLLLLRAVEELAQAIEAGLEHLMVTGHPFGFEIEPARAQRAAAHPSDLLRVHQPRRLEDPDVFLDPGQSHLEVVREITDRRIPTRQAFQNSPSSGVRERREGHVESV